MKKRLYEIDLVRSILILVLPLVHIYEYLGYQSQMSDILSDGAVAMLAPLYVFFTIFGAPLFMILMGMNMVFTRNNSPKDYFKRGIILLLIEIGLNLVRYIIPGFIGVYIAGFGNETSLALFFWMAYGLINSDIFALAGYSFLLVALFKKLNFQAIHILLASIVLFAIDCAFYPIFGAKLAESSNLFANELYGHIIYVNEDSIFPLLRWFVFIAVGYCIGSYINKKQFFKCIGIASLVATVGLIAYSIMKGSNPFYFYNVVENSNNLNAVIMLGELSMALLFMSAVVFIYRLFKLERFEKFNASIARYSSCISYNYAMQWIIVGWIMFITCGCGIWGTKIITAVPCMALVIGITVASHYLSRALKNFVKKHIV